MSTTTKTKITAPVPGFTGDGPGALKFDDGVAYTDNEAIINYCAQAGYGIGKQQKVGQQPLDTSELAQLRTLSRGTEQDLSSLSDDELREHLDAEGTTPAEVRDLLTGHGPEQPPAVVQVGTPLRDASVDPEPGDFLPPVNAGLYDPHGPLVVAPGIHASGDRAVRAGEVHIEDPAEQEELELAEAEKVLIDGEEPNAEAAAAQAAEFEAQRHADGESINGEPVGSGSIPAEYDPSAGTVAEVNYYLEHTSDPAEVARVVAAERAGKARAGILDKHPS